MSQHPSQGKDLNKGVYTTPVDFLLKIEELFPLTWDLAATDDNSVMYRLHEEKYRHYDEKEDALKHSWSVQGGYSWCNPPFSNIRPWVEKAWKESSENNAKIVMLLPMSHDTNWARDFVRGKCLALDIHGRITFEGQPTSYPKGLMLLVYSKGLSGKGNFEW